MPCGVQSLIQVTNGASWLTSGQGAEIPGADMSLPVSHGTGDGDISASCSAWS